MSVLLRLLPLLVVGCLLLQSLQPTAVSGQDVCDQIEDENGEVCDQTMEGEEALAFEDYVWEYANLKPTKKPGVNKKVIKRISVSYTVYKNCVTTIE